MSEKRYADGYRKLRKADEPRRIAYDVLHEVATQGAFARLCARHGVTVTSLIGMPPSPPSSSTARCAQLAALIGSSRATSIVRWLISIRARLSSCVWAPTSFSTCECPTTLLFPPPSMSPEST